MLPQFADYEPSIFGDDADDDRTPQGQEYVGDRIGDGERNHRCRVAGLGQQRGEGRVGAAAAGDAGQRFDGVLDAQHVIGEKEGDNLRDERDADAKEEQRQAIMLDGDQGLRPGGDADDANEHGQPEITQEVRRADRQRCEVWMHAAQPAEQQARQQAAAAAADRYRDAPDLELDHADQHADQHADAEKDEVGDGGGADLIADLRLHTIEVGRTAGEVQLVAGFQLELVEQGQIQSHALHRRQETRRDAFRR